MFRGVNDKRRRPLAKAKKEKTRKPKKQFFRKEKIKERERERETDRHARLQSITRDRKQLFADIRIAREFLRN